MLNDIEQYNFCFDNLEYKKLLKGDSESFLNYFMAKMQLKKAIQSEVVEKITSLQEEDYDKRYLCNGHDLLNVLSLATNRKISNDNPIKYTQDILENMLILGHHTLLEKFDITECADIIWDAKQNA